MLKRLGKRIKKSASRKSIGSLAMQQALLRAMIDALMNRLYQAHDAVTALRLKAHCAMLALVQRWQRISHQRVVNAVPVWHDEQHQVLWHLTVGVPLAVSALA